MLRPALIALAALWAVPATAQRCPDRPSVNEYERPFVELMDAARKAVGGGTVIATDRDGCEKVYEVKLIKDGVVYLVYVDAKTARVLGVVGG